MNDSVTPLTAAHQASLSFTISQSLLKFMSVESMMLSLDHATSWVDDAEVRGWLHSIGLACPKPSKEMVVVENEQDLVSWSSPRTYPSNETACPPSSVCFPFSTPASASLLSQDVGLTVWGSLAGCGGLRTSRCILCLEFGSWGSTKRSFLRAIRAKSHLLSKRSSPTKMCWRFPFKLPAVKGSRRTRTPPMVDGEETSAPAGLGRYWIQFCASCSFTLSHHWHIKHLLRAEPTLSWGCGNRHVCTGAAAEGPS